jgi:putative FmdB family regulatory protein
MPIYEYACGACGHSFELLMPIGAPLPEACPSCGAGEVHKLVSATSFVLKGGGWYKDGYGLNASAKASSTSSSSGCAEPRAAEGVKAAVKQAAK